MPLEISERCALPEVELALDVHFQCGTRPRPRDRLSGVPFAQRGLRNLGQEYDYVEPRQLVSSLLTNSCIWAHLGENPHVFEVRAGEALHVRERLAQVSGEALHDLCSPSLLALPIQNLQTDSVVEPHELLIHRQRCPSACALDLNLEARQPGSVIIGGQRHAAILRHPYPDRDAKTQLSWCSCAPREI